MPPTDDFHHDRLHALAEAALRARQGATDPAPSWPPMRRSRRVLPRLLLGATAWWIIVAQSVALLE